MNQSHKYGRGSCHPLECSKDASTWLLSQLPCWCLLQFSCQMMMGEIRNQEGEHSEAATHYR